MPKEIINPALMATEKKSLIHITCYGETETWTDREQAKAFYLEGMMNSEGSERDRYTDIYTQLCEGLTECSDELEMDYSDFLIPSR